MFYPIFVSPLSRRGIGKCAVRHVKHIGREKQSPILFSGCGIKRNKDAFCSFSQFSQRSQSGAEACCKQNMTLPITSKYSTNCMQMESSSDGCRDHLAAGGCDACWSKCGERRREKKAEATKKKRRRWSHQKRSHAERRVDRSSTKARLPSKWWEKSDAACCRRKFRPIQ